MAVPGVKAPRMPKGPKAPKTPDAKKMGDKASKKASGEVKKARKKLIKKLIFIAVALLLVGIALLIVWIVKGGGPAPSRTVQQAIDLAFLEDQDRFKTLFTDDSVEALESAWSGSDIGAGVSRGSWRRMMRGILTKDELKPKIVGERVAKDGESAEVDIDLDGVQRTIHLRKVEKEWRINVNLGINPNEIIIPMENLPEEIVEEFRLADPENEMWWEEREAAKAAQAEKKGCLGCAITASQGPVDPLALVALMALAAMALLRGARRRDRDASLHNKTPR